jgi:hypothetical protein
MKVNPQNILPSQDFLKPETLKYILECIRNGNLDKLPPNPIVREDIYGKMVAIDGHNLIAVKLLRNEDVDVHVAKSAYDGLPETSNANIQRNQSLKGRFVSVLEDRTRLQAEGINSFYDLAARYEDIL